MFRLFCLTLAVCLATTAAAGDRWPQFRGGLSDGATQTALPRVWDQQQNTRWKVSVPGEGWSCPVIWEDRLFLTTAVNQDQETQPEQYAGGGGRQRSDLTKQTYRWQVLCLDPATGKEIWRRTAKEGQPAIPRHSSNTYATETPLTDGERVYAYFGMAGLFCFDVDGKPLWEKDLGVFEMRAGWGTSSSPVLFAGRLFVQVDNEQQSFLVAFEAATGRELWRVPRDERSQYSSPVVWQNSHRSELIVGGMVCRSYDPETGRLLWSLDMQKGRSSATPLAVGDRLYVGTEFRDRGGADDGGGFLFCVKPGGDGDLSTAPDSPPGEFIQWKTERAGIQMASPVLCQGHLYLLERRSGILHCLNAETGAVAFRNRVPRAKPFWSSPWTDGEMVYCLDDDGTTHVLQGGPELIVVEQNRLDEQTWSSPAIANGSIFLRTAGHLYRIGD